MKPATKWILAIVGLLAGNVLAMVLLATVATVGRSEVVPEYSWHVDATLTGRDLEIVVRDGAGDPIEDAAVRVVGVIGELAHHAHGYAGRLDVGPGKHSLTITIDRGGARHVESAIVVAR